MPDVSDDLTRFLRVVRRRWTAARLLRAITQAATGAGVAVGLLLGIEYLFAPRDSLMAGLAGLALGGVAAIVIRAGWPLRRRPTRRQVARFVEERCPELEDRVATAADAGPFGSPFRAAVTSDAIRALCTVDPARVVASSDLWRAAAAGAAAVAVLAGLLGTGSAVVERVARSAWLYAGPAAASVVVEPGDARVAAGDPLAIRATLAETAGEPARSWPRLHLVTAGGATETLEMRPAGAGYQVAIAAVAESFTYRVTAATVASADFTVTALHPPQVRQVDVMYDYPAFTGLDRRVERDGGDVYAPVGTRVTISVETTGGVGAASLRFATGRVVPMPAEAGARFTATFEVERDDRYDIALLAGDGRANAAGGGYRVRAIEVRAPRVEVSRPGGDREITPLEEVVIEARADDDFGVDRFELVYAVRGRETQTVDLLDAPAREATGVHTIYAEDLDVAPGDFVSYHVRARDTDPVRGEIWTPSDIYFLEVRPFEREFEEAASRSTAGMDASAVANLAEIQKDVIAATWRLDRRSPAGSTRGADLATVAEAEADLRQQTRRVAVQLRARPRGAGPPPAGRPAVEALDRAVGAMARAEAALREGATSEALPHEMDALESLLRAQAGIRRQPVSFAGNGQGGQTPGMRAREDLSSLFDRDLRREQATNYEDRPAPSAPEDEAGDLLERLRALAARQEALTAAHDALSRPRGRDAPDEVRRTLERLGREQREVAAQTAALERSLETRRPAAVSSSSRPSDRMRHAGDASQRGDAAAAAARGREASAGLRRLERQVAAGAAGGRRRALAALGIEAGQIADEQRQIDRRAAALDPDRGAGGARRRLADREDAVADRVDAVRRQLRALAPSADGDGRDPLAAAAARLEAEAVAERLRRRAGEIRHGAAPGGAASESEASRLASALDRLAAQLAAAIPPPDGAEARDRLAADLDAAAAVRRNLAALERRLGAVAGAAPAADAPGEPAVALAAAALLERLNGVPEMATALEGVRPGAARDLARWAASGTEAFRPDDAAWERLRDDVRDAIEMFESSRRRVDAARRAHVGPGGEVPSRYAPLVDRYYRALADGPPR